jgi:hypothetical protein
MVNLNQHLETDTPSPDPKKQGVHHLHFRSRQRIGDLSAVSEEDRGSTTQDHKHLISPSNHTQTDHDKSGNSLDIVI